MTMTAYKRGKTVGLIGNAFVSEILVTAILIVFGAGVAGGHLDPAVTLGLLVGGMDFAKGIDPTAVHMLVYWAGQMIGGFLGAVVAFLAFKKHFDEEADAGAKLAIFSTGPAIRSYGWNFVTEVIGQLRARVLGRRERKEADSDRPAGGGSACRRDRCQPQWSHRVRDQPRA